MAEKRRRNFPAEAKMVNEWIQKSHPFSLQWRRVRLGPLPDARKPSYYTQLRRFVDLVFVENGIVYLVEAKVRPDPGGISQLELYNELFPQTPEFSHYHQNERKMIFLTSMVDEVVKKLCRDREIEYITFCPSWLQEYINKRIYRLG